MKAAVLVPGIMATRLELHGEEVWPPTPWETKFGYHRINELQDAAVQPTELVFSVLSFQFYSTIRDLLAELGYSAGGSSKRYVDVPYDWRRDLFDTVGVLANRLRQLHLDGATEIVLIGHSMGGLICRLLLEGGQFANEPWFAAIDKFIALAVPHLGAPLALARIFGVDATLGISAEDFAKLAKNVNYPSGYQLIPAPGEKAIWDLATTELDALDPYDPAVATKLGLVPALVDRARAVHDVLGKAARPAGVRYFYCAGVGHKTATRVNVRLGGQQQADHSQTVVTFTPDAGDGTVPQFSALPHLGQRQLVVNEHSTVFEGLPFKRVFARLFGQDAGPPVEVDGSGEPEATVALSVDSRVQVAGRPIEVTLDLIAPNPAASQGAAGVPVATTFRGTLILDLVGDSGRIEARGYREIPIAYDGPGINRIAVHLPAVDEPGLFLLRFSGDTRAVNDVRFAVSGA
ncbi:MAG: hypothetical protein H6843_06665 [Rhodospirillaceae bacterium]|nr:hypothetical protein [Rhodospirillaceae bacterium]